MLLFREIFGQFISQLVTSGSQTYSTMCDFYNFGLIFAGQMHSHCLPQRLKSTLFEIFSNEGCPKGTQSVEKNSNDVDFSL